MTDELERIRRRKMQALIDAQRDREETKEVVDEREKERVKLVTALFMPDAIDYLNQLKNTKPQLVRRIEDLAIALYLRRQLVDRIPKMGVILVQRKLEGVEPKITVKRRGEEAVSFYEAVRKDLEEQE